jgi:hypothetical protein
MDATHYRVIPIAAPSAEEHAQHYLWRFWRHLPRAGRMTIFDRSWYGRVLVERVEGFATEAEWRRAYGEINHFERQLTEQGVVVRKFWLHIDEQEQLRRFTAREKTAYKKHKITAEDYRNRQKALSLPHCRPRHDHPHEHARRPLAAGRRQRQTPRADHGDHGSVCGTRAGGGLRVTVRENSVM